MNRTDILKKFSAASITPSEQRLAIYEYLEDRRNHPTAERVWLDLRPGYPTMSRTTVHNTLNLFVRSELAQALTIEDGELRFDANLAFHAHFKCRSCGRIIDVFLPDTRMPQLPAGFPGIAESLRLDYHGVCDSCRG